MHAVQPQQMHAKKHYINSKISGNKVRDTSRSFKAKRSTTVSLCTREPHPLTPPVVKRALGSKRLGVLQAIMYRSLQLYW